MNEPNKAASDKLFEAIKRDHGVNTSSGVRALVTAMFATVRDDSQSEKDMLDSLALLTGMACGALLDLAERLEKEGQ